MMEAEWKALSKYVDKERHDAVARKLVIQERDAVWWKDASLSYFATFSKISIPDGIEKPQFSLEHYKKTDLLDEVAREGAFFDEDHK